MLFFIACSWCFLYWGVRIKFIPKLCVPHIKPPSWVSIPQQLLIWNCWENNTVIVFFMLFFLTPGMSFSHIDGPGDFSEEQFFLCTVLFQCVSLHVQSYSCSFILIQSHFPDKKRKTRKVCTLKMMHFTSNHIHPLWMGSHWSFSELLWSTALLCVPFPTLKFLKGSPHIHYL